MAFCGLSCLHLDICLFLLQKLRNWLKLSSPKMGDDSFGDDEYEVAPAESTSRGGRPDLSLDLARSFCFSFAAALRL